MKRFLTNFLRDFFISYGAVTLLILVISFIISDDLILILISKDFLAFMTIVVFFTSIGSSISFNPKFRHINIWLRRLVLWVYISILCDIGTYIFIRYILEISKDLTSAMVKVPINILVMEFPLYFIADKIEARKIKKMNASLKEYNQNHRD